jgi:Putative auto-transporter adhesin, head GIN domain
MKQIAFILLVMLQLGHLPLAAQKTIMDENAQVRPVGSFEAINVSSAFDVFLTQAPEHAVVVSSSDLSFRDQITTEVRNGTLFIGLKKSNLDWRGGKKLRAYISAPNLSKIELSGASDLNIENVFKCVDLELRLSGSSDFNGAIEAENIRLNSSGSSDYRLSGKAESIKISLSGSSDMKAYDFAADFCDISCSGTSDVEITVNKELSVNVSGASNVSYKGTAVVRNIKTSGSSNLRKKD